MKKTLSILLFLLSAQLSALAQATTVNFSLLYPRPATGSGDFIFTLGTDVLPKGEFLLFSQFDYGYRPLELVQNGTRFRGVVDHLLVQHLGGSYSFARLFSAELDLPVVWVNRFTDPFAATASPSNEIGLGDPQLRGRFTLFNREEHRFGLGFVPFLTIPAGSSDQLIGDRRVTGGLMAVLASRIKKRFSLGMNLGFEIREDINFNNFNNGSRFLASLGATFQASKALTLKGDVYVATPFQKMFQDEITTPSEAFLGACYDLGHSGFSLNAGGGFAISNGAGAPVFRTLTGLTYTKGHL